jgi:hypothetical protein
VSHKRGPTVIAAGDQQSRRDIRPVLAPEEVEVTLEDRPQADARGEPVIIEHEGTSPSRAHSDLAIGEVGVCWGSD